MKKRAGKYPVTYEGYGISAYRQINAIDGVCYSVDLMYKGDVITTIYSSDGVTELLTPLEDKYKEEILSILNEVVNHIHKIHNVTDNLRVEYLYDTRNIEANTDTVVAFFKFLWELNDLFDSRDEAIYGVIVVNCDNDSVLSDGLHKESKGFVTMPACTGRNTQQFITKRALYSLQVPAGTRVLHLTETEFCQGIMHAYRLNNLRMMSNKQ